MYDLTKSSCKTCPFCLSDNTKVITVDSQLIDIPSGLTRLQYADFEGFICVDCKSITSSRRFDEDQYSDGFYSNAKNYDRTNASYDYTGPLTKIIIEAANNGRVLDFGAGQGSAALYFKQLGVEIDVLDPDQGYQRTLKSKFQCVMSDMSEIQHKYSCIYAIGVLEHLSEIPETIVSLYKHLDNNGILVFQYPNPKSLSAKLAITKWDMLFESGHNFIPSVDGLSAMLARDDILIEKSYTSSILSRGRIPFKAVRSAKKERIVKKIIENNFILKFLYRKAWELQSVLGLGETNVVVIKKKLS